MPFTVTQIQHSNQQSTSPVLSTGEQGTFNIWQVQTKFKNISNN